MVLDPDTGDLLASASYPWPDATGPVRRLTRGGSAAGSRALRALSAGSTFKLVTAAAALRQD